MMLSRSQRLASQIFKFGACSANFSGYTNPKVIERHRQLFHMLDGDNKGFLILEEVVKMASEDVCKTTNATPEQTDKHTEAVTNFFSGVGMKSGVESKWPEYIKGMEVLIVDELEKWANKEPTVIRTWVDASFDIMDKSGDGAIDLEELQLYHKNYHTYFENPEEIKATFNICDINKNGKIDIEEFYRHQVGFWYEANPVSDGLFGPRWP